MSMSFLKQSTASQSRAIGPFVDDTDFKTAETGLTIANTDIKLVVNGAASANKNSGGGTHRVNGVYGITFDATDTATVGEMEVSVVVAGALPVFHKFFVLEEAVYDALFGASAPGYVANAPVNVAQFGGSNGTFSGGRPEVNTTHAAGTAWGSGAITAGSLATGAITAAKFAAGAIDAAALATDAATEIATAALTTQMTQSYRADGAAPTLAQGICEILGHLGESSISGTTKTVKQFDGSTSAMTFTLDDATTPTSITRAT